MQKCPVLNSSRRRSADPKTGGNTGGVGSSISSGTFRRGVRYPGSKYPPSGIKCKILKPEDEIWEAEELKIILLSALEEENGRRHRSGDSYRMPCMLHDKRTSFISQLVIVQSSGSSLLPLQSCIHHIVLSASSHQEKSFAVRHHLLSDFSVF